MFFSLSVRVDATLTSVGRDAGVVVRGRCRELRVAMPGASCAALVAAAAAVATAAAEVPSSSSCPPAEAACAADPHCAAFGVYHGSYQLHGCATPNALVPNNDWQIFVPTSAAKAAWQPLGKRANIDEAKCAVHPKRGGGYCGGGPPPPPPRALPYEALGAVDVGTLETSIFMLNGTRYIQDNIGCPYVDHWGNWPGGEAFKGHSYVRIRELASAQPPHYHPPHPHTHRTHTLPRPRSASDVSVRLAAA